VPIYDLVCEECGDKVEMFLKLNEKEPVCDKCGGTLKKAMSAPAFVLKGRNWYKDGYGLHDNRKKEGKNNA